MKGIAKKIIIVLVVLLLLVPIIVDVIKNKSIKEIKYAEYNSVLEDTAKFGFALVYVGEEDENISKTIKKTIDSHLPSEYAVNGYYMNAKDLSSEELASLTQDASKKSAYLFISNGEVIKTITDKLDSKTLNKYVDEYTVYTGDKLNGISEDMSHYKVLKTAKAYKKLVDDKKLVTMAVFGRDSCFYCNQFKPVYNTVAEEYNLNIYYFDSDSYDKTEYASIMKMGLMIPASCSDTQKEVELSQGFGTPLTLFTKNGKVIDCISGYIGKKELVSKLKTVGMIKSNK